MLKKVLIGIWFAFLIGIGFALNHYTQIQTCPKNYINFPTHIFGTKTVCIAKYEMRKGSDGEAVSTPKGLPWTNITLDEAIQACKANGSRYDLMSNQLWTVVAREIADVPENWSSGKEYVGRLNTGNVTNEPNRLLSATEDDEDACNQTGNSCSPYVWQNGRRTFAMASTQVLWDFSGNAAEWVTQSMSRFKNVPVSPFVLVDFRNPPVSRFGPYKACDKIDADSFYCGYGSMIVIPRGSPKRAAIARGGKVGNGRTIGGVFTVIVGLEATDKDPNLGFRCTFLPLKKIALAEIFDELNISEANENFPKVEP